MTNDELQVWNLWVLSWPEEPLDNIGGDIAYNSVSGRRRSIRHTLIGCLVAERSHMKVSKTITH